MKKIYVVIKHEMETETKAAFQNETDAFEYIMAEFEESMLNTINIRTTFYEYSEEDIKNFLKNVICNYTINEVELMED